MAWCIDDLEAWYLILEIKTALNPLHVLLDRSFRIVGSTNLLGNTTGLTCLSVCPSKLIKEKCLAGIDKMHKEGISEGSTSISCLSRGS